MDQQATLSLTGGTPPNNVGTFTASCGGAIDNAGNTQDPDPVSVTYYVVYERDGGILQPINYDDSSVFSRGKAVPVKFKLQGDESSGFDSSQFTLKKKKVSCSNFDAEGEELETVTDNPSQSFRYDPTDDQYIINADFRNETAGTCWRALVYLDDGSDPLTSPVFKLQK